jgi:hypothetical protein
MERSETKMDLEMLPCYSLRGILYVPHYNRQDKYVRPGYGREHFEEYSWMALAALGARKVMQPLWSRSWIKEIKNGK